MKRRIAYLVAGVVLLLTPAEAMAYLCLSVCNRFAPCDRVCQRYGGGPVTTCGAWGDCQGSFAATLLEPAGGTPAGVAVPGFLAPDGCGLSSAESPAASAHD